jgi:transposase
MEGEKKRRRKFDKEFKIQAVKLLLESGKTVEEVATDLGIYYGNLTRWKREYRRDAEEAFPGMGKLKPEDEELRRLKKENEDLRQEREILKKALAIFSKPQR